MFIAPMPSTRLFSQAKMSGQDVQTPKKRQSPSDRRISGPFLAISPDTFQTDVNGFNFPKILPEQPLGPQLANRLRCVMTWYKSCQNGNLQGISGDNTNLPDLVKTYQGKNLQFPTHAEMAAVFMGPNATPRKPGPRKHEIHETKPKPGIGQLDRYIRFLQLIIPGLRPAGDARTLMVHDDLIEKKCFNAKVDPRLSGIRGIEVASAELLRQLRRLWKQWNNKKKGPQDQRLLLSRQKIMETLSRKFTKKNEHVSRSEMEIAFEAFSAFGVVPRIKLTRQERKRKIDPDKAAYKVGYTLESDPADFFPKDSSIFRIRGPVSLQELVNQYVRRKTQGVKQQRNKKLTKDGNPIYADPKLQFVEPGVVKKALKAANNKPKKKTKTDKV